jgi:hypothetical protein
LFARKQKVRDALTTLLTRSVRVENKVQVLKEKMSAMDPLFGVLPEIIQFEVEMADTSQALSLATAALQFEQVTPRQLANRLPEFDMHLLRYEQLISAMQRSYAAASGQNE